MGLYGAYGCVVLHVALGALQDGAHPLPALVVGVGLALVAGLHVAAGRVQGVRDDAVARPGPEAPWLAVAPAAAFVEGEGRVVPVAGGEAVAIFRHEGRLSAVSNLCAHQNGPLGEGKVVDGCITCPWHGFQYRLEDGCAPPPYTEKLATYALRLHDGVVLLDPRPNPPGTRVAPLEVP
jgi:nitrite reductase/ring-hydroxylating ferredoxin subunit